MFGFIKDPHLMFGFRNLLRNPGWEQDILLKLNFIKDTMIANQVSTLIISGDLMDKSKEQDWTFKQYRILKDHLFDIFISNGIELYSIQGNHDMFDGHADLNGTVFGELCKDGIIKHLTKLTLNNFNIYGIDYHNEKDLIKDKFKEIISGDTSGNIPIICSHTNISPNENQLVDFTYNELSNLGNCIHLCGHYHLGFKPCKINNSVFINPYNLTRVARDYQVKMDEHIPELVLVDLNNFSLDNLEWVKSIIIPCKPFKEAFREEIQSLIEESKKFKFFEDSGEVNIEKLLDEKELSDVELVKVLINKHFESKNGIDKEKILSKVLEVLS